MSNVITIDGPSGVGKGTLSRKLACYLAWNYLDSGIIYRALALSVIQANIDYTDIYKIKMCAADLNNRLSISLKADTEELIVALDGEDVLDKLRMEKVGLAASQVSSYSLVREELLQLQLDFLKPPGLVADGRDMGSFVFKDAILKIFLTASAEQRALRRQIQLKNQGIDVNLAKLKSSIELRDSKDAQREVSPLKSAADAIVIDTTNLSVEQSFAEILLVVQQRMLVG